MIVDLMQFWLFSSFLLAGAAWSIDTLLRDRGVQLRGVWASAIGLTVVSPILPRIGSFSSDAASVGLAPTVDALARSVGPQPTADLGFLPFPGLWSNGVVLAAWAVLSAFVLCAGAVILLRLRSRANTWRAARVSGEDVLVAPDFGPAVVGLANPKVVLPEGLVRANAGDLDLILRHEREHIDARDPWLLLAGASTVALMPWNVPLVWQVMRLRAAVEEDCDLRVLRSGACPRSYGDLLVRMAGWSSGFGFAAAAMSERRSGLRRRLERLRDRRGQTRVAVTALLVMAGAGAIGVWMGLPSPVSLFAGPHSHGFAVVPDAPSLPRVPVLPTPPSPPALPGLPGSAPAVVDLHEHQLDEASQNLRRARIALERVRQEYPGMSSEVLLELKGERLARVTELRRAEQELEALMSGQPLREEIKLRVRREVQNTRVRVGDEERPLVYVNDVRFEGDVTDLDPNTVERVEVLKGPAALGVDSDAEFGLVRIYLKPGAGG